jgi:cytochrome d ubiquinol oxidase subunit II
MDLNTIWFVLVGVLIAGYGVLDGFDLGVGTLSLLSRSREERAAHIEAIAPFWDGNEVWLLTGGGALFAAFPYVYATVFSGFYLALMLLLVALIARVVALEYRNVVEGAGARRFFDAAFGVGSLLPAVLFGVAVGNVLRGVPVTADREWAGSFLGLLNPYAVVVGLVTLSLFSLHGALFLRLKTEGALAARLDRWIPRLWLAFVVLYALATGLTAAVSPFLFQGAFGNPLWIALALLLVAAVVTVPLAARAGRHGLAFVASGTTIVLMVLTAAVSMFPRIVPSSLDLAYSLTIYNASSSQRTLGAMLVIALIGVPIMLAYTIWAYHVFRGNVGTAAQEKDGRSHVA